MDITTTLNSALSRVIDQTIDVIAKEGLVVLKNVLDNSGFAKSEYLNNYEVFANVVGGKRVEFEIRLDVDSVVAGDEDTQQVMEEEDPDTKEITTRTYKLGRRGPQRAIDKRKPATDARRSAKDARRPLKNARKTSGVRAVEHDIALYAPRNMEIDDAGKLKVSIRRVAKKVDGKTKLPKGDFQGIVKNIMDELQKVITNNFEPKLHDIILDYAV
jgi:hypothetical protein